MSSFQEEFIKSVVDTSAPWGARKMCDTTFGR